jgi:hypothetical protein
MGAFATTRDFAIWSKEFVGMPVLNFIHYKENGVIPRTNEWKVMYIPRMNN